MAHGGQRPGAGRPSQAQVAERFRVLLEAIKPGEELDIRALLEAMIRHPDTTKTDRFRAIEIFAKLPREPLPRRSNNNNSGGGPLTIYALPRGSSVDRMTGEIIIPEDAELVPVVPFEGTPPWPAETSPPRSGRGPELERLEVMAAPDDTKVATLHPSYGRTFATGRRLSRGRLPDDEDPSAA